MVSLLIRLFTPLLPDLSYRSSYPTSNLPTPQTMYVCVIPGMSNIDKVIANGTNVNIGTTESNLQCWILHKDGYYDN